MTWAQGAGIFENEADWNPEGHGGVENVLHEPGSASFADGRYTLLGNGNDIWNDNDEGFYIYNFIEGNFSMQGRFEWIEPGTGGGGDDNWAKIGLMIREEPDAPDSKNYYVLLRGDGLGDLHTIQARPEKGANSVSVEMRDEFDEAIGAGALVRITRFENWFAAEYSLDDGNSWRLADFRQLDMADTVGVGLAVTNHEDNSLDDPDGPNDDIVPADDEVIAPLAEAEVFDVEIGDPAFAAVTRNVDPSHFEEQATLTVTLNILNASPNARTFTIEDTLPIGWTASNPSNGGTASGDTVSWTYEAPPGESTLTYEATTPANPGESGVWDNLLTIVEFDNNSDFVQNQSSALWVFPLMKENTVLAPALNGEITLDGRIDEPVWQDAFQFSFDTETPNESPGVLLNNTMNAEDTANVWAFHDANNIYVAVEVLDDDLHPYFWWEEAQDLALNGTDPPEGFDFQMWEYDGIEMFLDGDLSRLPPDGFPFGCTGQGFITDAAGRFPFDSTTGENFAISDTAPTSPGIPMRGEDDQGEFWFTESTPEQCWDYGARLKPDLDGYVTEFKLKKDLVLEPRDQTLVGFDFTINGSTGPFDSPEGSRESKWGWFNVDQNTMEVFEPWNNEQGWGLMELTGDPGQGVDDWANY